MKLQILKNVPKWEEDMPNMMEHERRQLARQIGEALYDGGYIKIEEGESFVPVLNTKAIACEKSTVIKMTFVFSAPDDMMAGGV